jgi:translation initiation factor 1
MTKPHDRTVFSTRSGDQRKLPEPSLAPAKSLPPQQQNLKVLRDKKGRNGKVVTVITELVLTEDDLKALAKELKNMCGAGGTTKIEPTGLSIEIQGDHREKIAEKLKALGYKVKLAGG